MRSCFAVFCPDFKSASQLRKKAEASSIVENRFDRVSNGIVDALKDLEDILEMGGAVVEIVPDLACDHFLVAAKVTFQSDQAYVNNVFRAKIMPCTNDLSLITCAKDGEVRHARSLELKLDGVVKQIALRRTTTATTLFMCQPTYNREFDWPVIPLKHIAVDPRNPNLFALVGTDEYTRF
ncbi:hypothetical protein V6N13_107668 [Hibiscus sabdariffa]